MPLEVWERLEFGWINIALICMLLLFFVVWGLFKLRKGYMKIYLIQFMISVIMIAVVMIVVSIVSPKVVYMNYKYEENTDIFWLTNEGWEIVQHYGDKKIVQVRRGT